MYLTTKEAADRLGLSPHTLRVQVGKGSITAERIKGDYVFHEDEIERYRHVSLGRQGFASARHPHHVAAMYDEEREFTLTLYRQLIEKALPHIEAEVRALSSPPFDDDIRAANPALLRYIRSVISHLQFGYLGPGLNLLITLERLRSGEEISPLVEQMLGPAPAPDAADPAPFNFGRPPRRQRTAKPKPDVLQAQQSEPPPTFAPVAVAAGADADDP